MSTARLLPAAGLLLAALLAAGCAGPMSRELIEQADQSLTVDKVMARPEGYVNARVVWGGEILSTSPQESSTVVEISERPLDYQKRPEDEGMSRGRFLARYKGFLDPSVFKYGKDITVIGRITGTDTGRIGEYEYTYPVVSVEEYYLWGPEAVYSYPPSMYYYYPYTPYYGPWWYYY
jgi:outer membrane lipoprotein